MKKRILPIIFAICIATLGFIIIENVLAAFTLTNTGTTVNEGGTVTLTNAQLTITDTLNPTAVFTYTILDTPDNGDLRRNAIPFPLNGTFTQAEIDLNQISYQHNGSETITDSFQFNVSNGITIVLTSTFAITITPINDGPTPFPDTITLTEGSITSQLTIPNANSVIFNDIDPENDTLTATLITSPTNATTFQFNSNGTFNYAHDGSETTTDIFSYAVCDNGTPQECNSIGGIVNINIIPVNDPPVATNDTSLPVNEGATVATLLGGSSSVRDNDSDVDDLQTNLTTAIVISPIYAAAFTLNPNGTFSYTHDGSENYTDSFIYQLCDDESPTPACDNATVTLDIQPVNDPPIANGDTATLVNEGATVSTLLGGSSSVRDNDSDPDDLQATLTATLVTSPIYYSVFTLNLDGTFTYTHDGSENYTDSFIYQLCDDESPIPACDSAIVTLNIQPVNDDPIANGDSTVPFDEGATVSTLSGNSSSVLDNDIDVDDLQTILTATLVTSPTYAAAFTFNSDGTFSYTHDGSENLVDSFVYRVCDDEAPTPGCDIGTVTLTATNVNDAPEATDDTAVVDEGDTVTTVAAGTSVRDNDNDVDADDTQATLSVSLLISPTLSSAFTLNSDGTFSYTHNGSENFSDTFTYQLCDDETPAPACDTGRVDITIIPVNDPPIAVDDSTIQFAEGATVSTLTSGSTVLTNDNDVDDDAIALMATLVTSPMYATAFTFNSDGTFSYTHDGSENFVDSFVYRVCDDEAPTPGCDIGTVTLTATNVNDAPEATDDTAVVDEGATVTTLNSGTSVLDNDNDVDADDTQTTLTVTLIASPTWDTAFTLNPDGTFSYTHDGSENFSDTFIYQLCDDEFPTPACDTGTVNITITPVNDTPHANNDTAVPVDEGNTVNTLLSGNSVFNNDSDDDLDDLQSTWVATLAIPPTYASAFTLNANGTFTYTHDGTENFTDNFEYQLCDNELPTPACDTATVNITITPVNDTPQAADDTTSPVSEGESVNTLLSGTSVLDNDSDADLDDTQATWTATIVTPPTYASAFIFNPDGTFSYTHDGSGNFVDSFEYQVCDNELPTSACDIGTVNIAISTVPDPPTAVSDIYYLLEGGSISENVTNNDYDEEGDPFVVITPAISPPAYAVAFSLNGDGSFIYEHSGTEEFADSFIYRVCQTVASPISDCTETAVTLIITPTNDAPTTAPDLFYVPRSTTLTTTLEIGATSVISNDTDAEGNTLIVNTTPVVPPNQAAAFTLNADGTFVYTHDDSSDDPDSFVYEVCDDGSPQACSTETVTITIRQRPTTLIYLPAILNNYSPDEPNNDPCTAYPISVNTAYNFMPNDQEDWYRIILPALADLTFTVEEYGLNGDLIVYQSADCIIDNADEVRNDGSTNSFKTVHWNNAPAGTYFVRVFTTNPALTAPSYKLMVTTE